MRNCCADSRSKRKPPTVGSVKKFVRSRKVWAAIVFAVIVLGTFSYYIVQVTTGAPLSEDFTVQVRAAEAAATTKNDVVFPESTFADGKARFFEHRTPEGTTVKYFILKSSDGVIRAAFDACDVCWEARKGYSQKGDFMVCRNCGRRFQSTKVNVVTGGCNPSTLTRSIKDGNVIIPIQALNEGRKLFK